MHTCKECGKKFVSKVGMSQHVRLFHYAGKEYYDKYIKTGDEGKCKICGKPTKFKSIFLGYRNCCSKNCTDIYRFDKVEKSNLNKFGVKNTYQRKEIIDKARDVKRKKYGSEKYTNPDKRKETNLKKIRV